MTNEITHNQENKPPGGQVILYSEGEANINVRVEGETVWLTQRAIAELYGVSVKTVNEHLVNIYEDGELSPEATIRKFRIVQLEGNRDVSRLVDHYSLEAILAVGYRVRSPRGTLFRQWATQRLEELLRKGFTMDDERIKQGRTAGDHYFEELLERIRDIRASERLFYQKVTDIYSTSIDYDPKSEASQEFFATVQNKLYPSRFKIPVFKAANLVTQGVYRGRRLSPLPATVYTGRFSVTQRRKSSMNALMRTSRTSD